MSELSEEYAKSVKETQVFYDRLAPYYDEFVPLEKMRTERIPALESYIISKLAIVKGSLRVLELGCGTGSYAIPLAIKGYQVTGVDISPKMRDVAFQKLGDKLPQNFTYLVGDWLTETGKWEKEFDCVLCIGNSLSHNPPESLKNLFSVVLNALKPGGLFIVSSRRIEKELDMSEGPDMDEKEICRSGGPAYIPGVNNRNVLRYMLMTKLIYEKKQQTVLTFYTYDNYEKDRRRFVYHRMVFNNTKELETIPLDYDSWSTRQYFIYEKSVITSLKNSGFSETREESPNEEYFGQGKNWYITARKPLH